MKKEKATAENQSRDLPDKGAYRRVYALSRMVSRFSEAYSSRVKEVTGLTTTQVDCLRVISESGPITIGRMGKTLGLSPSLATNAADALEKRELISRTRTSEDRRTIHLKTTAQGAEATKNLPTPLVALYEKCLSDIDPSILVSMSTGLEALAKSLSEALPEE